MTEERDLIIMLGDSLTAGGRWSAAFPALKIRNLGINGDTCAGVWGRLDELPPLKPAKFFLQIGINDFLRGATVDDVVSGHLRIWEEVADSVGGARLLVQSLLPYVEAALPYLPPNLDVMTINRLLGEKAGEWNLTFIDLFPRLADEDNQLRLEYTSDGLHLTEEAYAVWAEQLRPYMENNQ